MAIRIYACTYIYILLYYIHRNKRKYVYQIERVHHPDFMHAHRHHSKCSKEIWITCKAIKSYLLEYLKPIQAINNHIMQQYPYM